MKIDILTIFPKMFEGPFSESIIKRAQEKNLVEINVHNLRNWTTNKHNTVDDKPYGGGAGMVLMVEPIFNALKDLKSNIKDQPSKIILLSPQGKLFNQQEAKRLSTIDHLILVAGHYEGFDQRIRDYLVDEEVSIGNYVLTGGELPAMIVTDSIIRLIPGVLGDNKSLKGETHSQLTSNSSLSTNIKHPVYTRPEEFNGWKVPKVLLSGNHAEIKKWERETERKTNI